MTIRNFLRLGALIVALGATTALHGQTILVDDFEDGDDAGWTHLDFSAGQPWGPGVYDASSGSYNIRHSGIVPGGTPVPQKTMISSWDASSDPEFSNGILRATVRTNNPNNATTVAMRFDLSTFTGYTLIANTGGNVFNLQKFVGGIESSIWRSDFAYNVDEDWNVELGAVGDQLSARVWKVGDPEPEEAQFIGFDSSAVLGQFVVASDTTGEPSFEDGQGNGVFDDIYFTPMDFAPITVDIRPGSGRNPVNLKSKGLLPVAIVSTSAFDALNVDVESLLFGDPVLMNAGATPVSPSRSAVEDITGDGLLDLSLMFSTQELVDNGVLDQLTMEGRLGGNLLDGTVIAGRDAVIIVPAAVRIPEPASVALVLLGMLTIHVCRRR